MKIKRIENFGSLVHFTEDCTTFRLNKEETRDILNYEGTFPKGDVSAPEVVHLELTSRCNKNCEYCYVENKDELTTEEWKKTIDDIVDNGIFQFTFGGGEPFMRDDIFELAEYIRQKKKRNLAVTTNGTLLEDNESLGDFDQINFSYHGSISDIREPVKTAQKYANVGVNFLLKYDTIEDLPEVVKFCKNNDLELLIMTYKPVNNDWEQLLSPNVVYDVAERVNEHGVKVSVDMMTCEKCTGGEYFCTIDSDGKVYQCSFVRRSMGNILNKSFKEIWNDRKKKKCPYLMKEKECSYLNNDIY